jgi:pilus assembly protein Flp/PilA
VRCFAIRAIEANRTTVGSLRAIGARSKTRMAHALRFHRLSRGRSPHRDRNSNSRLCASVNALEERNMELIARLKKFAVADEGQDLLEYALLVALIALVAVGAVTLAGKNVNTIFGSVASQLSTASSS